MSTVKICFVIFMLQFFVTNTMFQTMQAPYTAVVVEYHPNQTKGLTADEILMANTNEYLNLLDKATAETKNVDIVVFPEATLTWNHGAWNRTALLNYTTYVPDPATTPTICNTTDAKISKPMNLISCAAKEKNVYIAMNLFEVEDCNSTLEERPCAPDGWNMYNTEVVFNRQGQLVARYRKYNLFGETLLNVTKSPDIITFTTDFNVTFGIFTCFDILFPQPTQTLVRQGVRNFVFSSMWFSETPFLTAVQVQQMWAYENNVVLLASGALNVQYGSGGTGIFNGKQGPLNATIQGINESRYFTATVEASNKTKQTLDSATIDKEALPMDNFGMKTDNYEEYITEILDTNTTGWLNKTICTKNSSLCCHFKVNTTVGVVSGTKNSYMYRLAVYDSIKNFDYWYYGGQTVCGIMSCTNETLSTCGERFPNYTTVEWPVVFESITIEADYRNVSTSIQFPNSLLSNIQPLPISATTWTTTDNEASNTVTINYKLTQPQERLMSFAIYGRDFSKDHPPKTSGEPGCVNVGKLSLYTALMMILVYFIR